MFAEANKKFILSTDNHNVVKFKIMKNYLSEDPWKIIEEGFHPEYNKISESIFSLGNGMMGHRGTFEEKYTGDSLQGNYIAGIYYPDKTIVGWWKNGYPEYFAKVLNCANWIGIDIKIGDIQLDLNEAEILSFRRCLNMKEGVLSRNVLFRIGEYKFKLHSERFCSYDQKETGWLKYNLKSVNYEGPIEIKSYVDFDVRNQDSNYDEDFWNLHCQHIDQEWGHVFCKTKKTDFKVCVGMINSLSLNGEAVSDKTIEEKEEYVAHVYNMDIKLKDVISLEKCAATVSNFHHGIVKLTDECQKLLKEAESDGYNTCRLNHLAKWDKKWQESDIQIDGDVSAQQGIRFNIFHLNQTYTGEDDRLNIGPKGFTGEKYGGSTYWDTEAYCLPFYLSTADQKVARNLLVYRYNHLEKAIENAKKLGHTNGAALYPMVTINGEECHNEWEITFEEIHRNGAIAYAIFDYIRYTEDSEYLMRFGLEVLISISRFWAQRVNWSDQREKYVLLGVTGPNEYENNVNNNWYTNYLAVWCLKYTLKCIEDISSIDPEGLDQIFNKCKFDQEIESKKWQHVIDHMYFPYDEKKQIYLQQDGYLDKEIIPVAELAEVDKPINQNWSWDRILRSCYIKQADTLQGFYFFEDDFSVEEHKRHFHFYEPLTVHESSLSPCVHSILASRINDQAKAYEMYLRTSRLDLDDYNNDTEDGLHITSMAGTWMTITKGFAGMRMKEGVLHFTPHCPHLWNLFSFVVKYKNEDLKITIEKSNVRLENLGPHNVTVYIFKNEVIVPGRQSVDEKY